jgi:hypothetical protein
MAETPAAPVRRLGATPERPALSLAMASGSLSRPVGTVCRCVGNA